MSLATWLTLLSAWIVAVASPGPDFLAVMRTSATSGRRKWLFVAAGVTTGIALCTLVTVALGVFPQPLLDLADSAAVFLR